MSRLAVTREPSLHVKIPQLRLVAVVRMAVIWRCSVDDPVRVLEEVSTPMLGQSQRSKLPWHDAWRDIRRLKHVFSSSTHPLERK